MQKLSQLDVERLLKRATYASTGVVIVLITIKTFAWLWTDSISILASLVDSCLDAAASLLNLLAIRQALMPADKHYRFGYGKLESLAGLGQAVFITTSAIFLLFEAYHRFTHPQPIQAIGIGLGVTVISIILTLALVAFQKHVINKTQSTAIGADALHYQSDLLMNISVIIALGLSVWGWQGFDAIFGFAIGLYILFSAYQIIRHAMHDLMDKELSFNDRERIKATALSHPKVLGVHDLRTRKSGITCFIQLHIEIDDQKSLFEAHQISDEVEAIIAELFPSTEIIIHQDPAHLIESHPNHAVDE
ncbi:MAG: cation diffusion facilitator family transporter [Zetaproteobacteria bacterium]|nr:cation diffusion facilitator family transporter [Zetaproteobacteria bacterium]